MLLEIFHKRSCTESSKKHPTPAGTHFVLELFRYFAQFLNLSAHACRKSRNFLLMEQYSHCMLRYSFGQQLITHDYTLDSIFLENYFHRMSPRQICFHHRRPGRHFPLFSIRSYNTNKRVFTSSYMSISYYQGFQFSSQP